MSGAHDPLQSPATPPPPDDPGRSDEAARSPVRPSRPTLNPPAKPRLIPAKPPTGPLDKTTDQTESRSPATVARMSPQETLEHLRQRMTSVAEEFAQGRINRAQFHAIYNRYGEQRLIIEALLSRNPQSDAWKTVARPGHTSFLRQHFAARLLFYALFPLGQIRPIVHHGSRPPRPKDIIPILQALPDFIQQKGPLGPAKKRVRDGSWLVIVPGKYTVSLLLYSLEPSAQQIMRVEDLHADFERANARALSQADYTQERLVFPQRALFEAPAADSAP